MSQMSHRRNKGVVAPGSSTSFSTRDSSSSSSRIGESSNIRPRYLNDKHVLKGITSISSLPTNLQEVTSGAVFGSLEEDGSIYDEIEDEKDEIEDEKDPKDDKVLATSAPRKNSMEISSRQSQWVVLAVASGACAAFNGVFAKLTTSDFTTSIATSLSSFLRIPASATLFEATVRVIFFGLNLVFNGIMWTLFTKALACGTSTRVSIINVSSNFVITALLGFVIFSEKLPPAWWAGATLLVTGSVIISAREEKDEPQIVNVEDKYKDQLELGRTAEEEAKRFALLDSEDLLDFEEQRDREELLSEDPRHS